MGPNSPQKFSAAKLFGFGGDSKKTPEPKPAPVPEPQHSSFANSFSTQAIKMESNKFDSFKGKDYFTKLKVVGEFCFFFVSFRNTLIGQNL